MQITWHDLTAPVIQQEKMTTGEIGAIERELAKDFQDKTFTFQKLRRMGDVCVCDHKSVDHRRNDDSGEISDDTSCARCDCDAHEPNVSPLVQVAFMWASLKRSDPSLKWSDVRDSPLADFDVTPDGEADPIEPSTKRASTD